MDENSIPDIEFRSVFKNYGEVVALEGIEFAVPQGTFLSILGPSGCGKTTSLRLIAGFEFPTHGDVLIQGESVIGVPAYRRHVNMVFQHYALFPHLTVAENIAYGLKNQRPRLDKAEIARRVDEALEKVQLAGFAKRRSFEMSGGQQQRVALARALVNRPKVLLLDEPLAALDRKLREDMQFELQSLQRDLGITFVLVTHDQEEAMSMSDVVCLMRQGQIVQMGPPQDLYDQPATAFVAGFVGKSNLFTAPAAEADTDRATIVIDGVGGLSGRRPANSRFMTVGKAVTLSVRPEVLSLASRPEALPSTVTVPLRGRVCNRIFLGDKTEYRIVHPVLGDVLALRPRQEEAALGSFSEGDEVAFGWASTDALVLV